MKFQRQVGSGAFGRADPMLKGDVTGDIGRLRLLFELKSHHKVDGKGQKTITIPISVLDKVVAEADSLDRIGMVIFHSKGSSDEYAILKYSDLHRIYRGLEERLAGCE